MAAPIPEKTIHPFEALGLDPRLTGTLAYPEPSPIQKQAIPVLLTGKDLVGLAGTGTGKTAAFALPALHKLATAPAGKGVAVLILVPTRELAIQVAKAVKGYGKPVGVDVVAVYGGTAYSGQIQAISRGVKVVVATPGRALDLFRKGKFPLDDIQTVVLDEADEMLDMGFAEDIDAMLAATPKERQTMLFSATMPPRIEEIAKRHLRKPTRIQVVSEAPKAGVAVKVQHMAYLVPREHKLAALGRVLDIERPTSAIIFCRTRSEVDDLTEMMHNHHLTPIALHGGLTQEQRDHVMQRFRSGKSNMLVATDIAARGLDISHLSHVINYDIPAQGEAYVHRTGRVGRAGREGVAITFISGSQRHAIKQIERLANVSIPITPVPTLKMVQEARMKRLKDQLTETIEKTPPHDDLRAVLSALEKDHKVKDVALAALYLMIASEMEDDAIEIPEVRPEATHTERSNRTSPGEMERRRAGGRPTRAGMAKIFFGIGRDAGITPRDLVGAITNEAGIPGKDLGVIDLTDRFSLVEVPSDAAEYVIESMQNTRIRGRRVMVRADRPPKA